MRDLQVRIVDNLSQSLLSVLSPEIEQCKEARIAVAFVSRRGLAMIEPAMQSALQAGASFEFLIGLDMHTTEPDALRNLYELACAEPNVGLCCYSSIEAPGIYHPKLYLLSADTAATSIVGSSNLTEGGLKKNIEINAVVKGNTLDDAITDAYTIYDLLAVDMKRKLTPDEEYVSMYAELFRSEKAQRRSLERNSNYQSKIKALKDKEKSLRPPPPLMKDLRGWSKLVYDELPYGEFTTKQAQSLAHRFEERYPRNTKIEEKIRQQLQLLAKWEYIEHPERGHWHKK